MSNLPIDEFVAVAAQDTFYDEEEFPPEELVYYEEPVVIEHVYHPPKPISILVILVPLFVIMLFAVVIYLRVGGVALAESAAVETAVLPASSVANDEVEVVAVVGGADTEAMSDEETAVSQPIFPSSINDIIAPYDDFVLTQGIHGASYGHMAIDIAAGNGAIIYSPIDGLITSNYIDEYLNTVLIIENDKYEILMLHGDYLVVVGDEVKQGQPVGNESNHGYTKDMYGNLCYQRDCGYHTHLNIYDKTLGKNVNPLDVLDLN